MITHPLLAEALGIRHGFFTRQGGTSTGLYAGCNVGLGSNDDRETVLANRALCMQRLDPQNPPQLATCYQVHSADVVTVDAGGLPNPPKADGLVTRHPNVAIGVLSADCAPILFADPDAQIIGAAHAGWGGALNGIGEAVVAAMVDLGAKPATIRAVIGPCIAQRSYQVGAEYRDRFLSHSPDNDAFFQPDQEDGKFRFDLPSYVLARLTRAGVTAVWEGSDTMTDSARFYSYRRATLAGEPDYGRGLSAIMLDGK
ncbi:MAG: peptidoglycan editing factor PgeF [Pseudomonadota bacterium]